MINKNTSKNKGFTLTEMLVVMAIVAVLMTVVVFNYQDINSKSILRNVAYEVALSIREVQSLGLGAKKYVPTGGGASDGNFTTPFGAQFNTSSTKYMIFADEDEDNQCDASDILCTCPDGECLSEIGSSYGGIQLYDTCVSDDNGDNSDCLTDTSSSASVIFKRPNPDAKIYHSSDWDSSRQLMRIFFKSKRSDDTQMIKITNTGQISVKMCDISVGDYKEDCV